MLQALDLSVLAALLRRRFELAGETRCFIQKNLAPEYIEYRAIDVNFGLSDSAFCLKTRLFLAASKYTRALVIACRNFSQTSSSSLVLSFFVSRVSS